MATWSQVVGESDVVDARFRGKVFQQLLDVDQTVKQGIACLPLQCVQAKDMSAIGFIWNRKKKRFELGAQTTPD